LKALKDRRLISTDIATMEKQLIKSLAIGRLVKGQDGKFLESEHQTITSVIARDDDPLAKQYRTHVRQIMGKASKLSAGKRISLTSEGDEYHLQVLPDNVTTGDSDTVVVFFAVTDPQFGKYHSIPNFLEEFKATLHKACSPDEIKVATTNGVVHDKTQDALRKLLIRYSGSKIKDVEDKVDEVKTILKDSVDLAVVNTAKMEEAEHTSQALEEQSQLFKKETVNVRRRMRTRNYVLIGLAVAAFLAILIYIIVAVTKS